MLGSPGPKDNMTTTQPEPPIGTLALIAVAHGIVAPLYGPTGLGLKTYVDDVGWNEIEGAPHDGVWVCELSLVDDGPGDWPGARECKLTICHYRRPTLVEWSRHVADEHPWGVEP